MKRSRGRPRKQASEGPLIERMEIRISTADKEQFELAADASGVKLSDWMRSTLRQASERKKRKAGDSNPSA